MKNKLLIGILIMIVCLQGVMAVDYHITNCGTGTGGLYSGTWDCFGDKIILDDNITCTGTKTPLCTGGFVGPFEGQGNHISNLVISGEALFGADLFTQINDLGLENVTVTGNRAAAIVNVVYSGASLNNCYATGSITATDEAGGLAIELPGVINNSFFNGDVTGSSSIGGIAAIMYEGSSSIDNSYSSGTVTGTQGSPGGLVGSFSDGLIFDSYSSADITGRDSGGLVGYANSGTIENSYAAGNITGTREMGGLVGYDQGVSVTNSFWDVCRTGISSPCLGYSNLTPSGCTGVNTVGSPDDDYFYDVGNAPMSSWSGDWDTVCSTDLGYQPLSWENAGTGDCVSGAACTESGSEEGEIPEVNTVAIVLLLTVAFIIGMIVVKRN